MNLSVTFVLVFSKMGRYLNSCSLHFFKVDDFEFAWFDNHLSIIYNNFIITISKLYSPLLRQYVPDSKPIPLTLYPRGN